MRVTETDPVKAPDTNVDATASQESDKDKASPFAKLLSRKQQPDQDADRLGVGKGPKSELDASMSSLLENETRALTVGAPSTEDKHVVTLPPQLQELVREISLGVNASGQEQVQIDLNSNVLKGLQIRIEKHEGGVAIQFQSSSEEVASLLSKSADTLSRALVDRGLTVLDIRVSSERAESRFDSKNRFNQRGNWQGAGRQGRR
jgi:hypothetical protein